MVKCIKEDPETDNFGTPTDNAFARAISLRTTILPDEAGIYFDLVTEYAIGNGRDRQLYTEWRTDLEYDPEN
jgi:hypothetical protein